MNDREQLAAGVATMSDGDREQLLGILGRMPDRMRRAVTLRHVYQMAHAEIAARLQMPESDLDELLAIAAIEIKNGLELNIFQRAWRKVLRLVSKRSRTQRESTGVIE